MARDGGEGGATCTCSPGTFLVLLQKAPYPGNPSIPGKLGWLVILSSERGVVGWGGGGVGRMTL